MFSFLFGKRKKKPERPAVRHVNPSAEQKRSTFRMPVEFDVFYTLEGRPGRRSARANDLSAGGLRLECDEDFIKGPLLTLDFQLPDEFLSTMVVEKEMYEQSPFGLRPETVKVQPPGFNSMRVEGKVLATYFDPEARKLAHGIAFENLEKKTEEELQRFMHLWQIHYLRTRKGEWA